MPVKTTRDTFYGGRLVLSQPSDGYRISIDSLLLAHFSYSGRGAARCIDLGSGSGIVGISLLAVRQVGHVTAVELQPELANLSAQNAAVNNFTDRYVVLNEDVRNLESVFNKRPQVDLVVMNPPFWPLSHRLPSNSQRKIACHEVFGTIEDWTLIASRLISGRKGRISVVYPSRRLNELLIAFSKVDLFSSRLRMVHPNANSLAELTLVEVRPNSCGSLSVLPPLFLKNSDGTDTEEVDEIVSGAFSKTLFSLPDTREVTQ
jgi:tRNA1Val (adenine37-N6)-methyltransferase